MERRDFLKGMLAMGGIVGGLQAGAAGRAGESLKEDYDFYLTRVRFGGHRYRWNYCPGGDANVSKALARTVHCKAKVQSNVRDDRPESGREEHFCRVVDLETLDSEQQPPFLLMSGQGHCELNKRQLDNLKEYVQEGGFVLMDECAAPWHADEFYTNSVRWMVQLFGREAVRMIPHEHEVFCNVHDLSDRGLQVWLRRRSMRRSLPGAKATGVPDSVGVFLEDRLAVFISNADIHCGWSDPRDSWVKRADHRTSIQAGVNIITYALSH